MISKENHFFAIIILSLRTKKFRSSVCKFLFPQPHPSFIVQALFTFIEVE